jgi:hypothetical protein
MPLFDMNNGGNLKNFKQPLLTIFVIFATAYIFSLMGCSGSSGGVAEVVPSPSVMTPNGQNDQLEFQPNEPNDQTVLKPINANDMRECTNEELTTLTSWSNSLTASDEAINTSDGRKSDQVVKLAQEAMQKCDYVEFYHTQKPCKKIKRVITTPDNPTITAYDAYRIDQRCKSTENYLLKFKLRPNPKQVTQPKPQPISPVTPAPTQPKPIDPSELRQCSADEFSKLNTWKSSVDLANKNIAKLGQQTSWKYNQNAIDAAKTATVSCEALMKYHQVQPCKREKSYTAETLKEQCQTSRQYYYNFAQRTDSLITPNAKLYLDTRVIANRTYEPGPANLSVGLCILTNQSNSVITYSGQKTLVTEARVYPDQEHKMFVIVTAEGLKFECYGVDYQSAATSLNEVLRLLLARDTNLPLTYELN